MMPTVQEIGEWLEEYAKQVSHNQDPEEKWSKYEPAVIVTPGEDNKTELYFKLPGPDDQINGDPELAAVSLEILKHAEFMVDASQVTNGSLTVDLAASVGTANREKLMAGERNRAIEVVIDNMVVKGVQRIVELCKDSPTPQESLRFSIGQIDAAVDEVLKKVHTALEDADVAEKGIATPWTQRTAESGPPSPPGGRSTS